MTSRKDRYLTDAEFDALAKRSELADTSKAAARRVLVDRVQAATVAAEFGVSPQAVRQYVKRLLDDFDSQYPAHWEVRTVGAPPALWPRIEALIAKAR